MANIIYGSGDSELLTFWELSEDARTDVLGELDGDMEAAHDGYYFYIGDTLWSLGDFMRLEDNPEGWQASAHISNTSGCLIRLERCPYSGDTAVLWQIVG